MMSVCLLSAPDKNRGSMGLHPSFPPSLSFPQLSELQ